ncbi:MAG: hypothetical protein V8R01_07505 [Bacilli bacterium]
MTVNSLIELFKKILDILLVWGLLYFVLKSLRKNVKMVLLFKGVLIIVIVKILLDFFGFGNNWLLNRLCNRMGSTSPHYHFPTGN